MGNCFISDLFQVGIKNLVIFINKADIVDEEFLELVEIEMIDLLNEFGFDGEKTPIVKGKVQTLLLDHIGLKKSSSYILLTSEGPSINDDDNFYSGFLTPHLPHVGSFLVLSVGIFDQFLKSPPSQLPTLFMDGPYCVSHPILYKEPHSSNHTQRKLLNFKPKL